MQRSSQTARKGWHRGAPIILEVGLEHDRMELGTVNVGCKSRGGATPGLGGPGPQSQGFLPKKKKKKNWKFYP